MIEHTVTFSLKHPVGSREEADFLQSAAELATIPGVNDFRIRMQVSQKNPHSFAITMRFASEADFERYNSHPRHVAFVNERWLPEVEDFREADFVGFPS